MTHSFTALDTTIGNSDKFSELLSSMPIQPSSSCLSGVLFGHFVKFLVKQVINLKGQYSHDIRLSTGHGIGVLV